MANTVCHIEFDTTDLARSQAFFGGVFDWTFRQFTEDMVVFGSGDAHLGGLMRVDEVKCGQSPSVWIQVESVDESLAKAVSLGGSILSPKGPVPHVGWSARFSDLDGNSVGIVEFEKQS